MITDIYLTVMADKTMIETNTCMLPHTHLSAGRLRGDETGCWMFQQSSSCFSCDQTLWWNLKTFTSCWRHVRLLSRLTSSHLISPHLISSCLVSVSWLHSIRSTTSMCLLFFFSVFIGCSQNKLNTTTCCVRAAHVQSTKAIWVNIWSSWDLI